MLDAATSQAQATFKSQSTSLVMDQPRFVSLRLKRRCTLVRYTSKPRFRSLGTPLITALPSRRRATLCANRSELVFNHARLFEQHRITRFVHHFVSETS
jgi:hypothetical protein